MRKKKKGSVSTSPNNINNDYNVDPRNIQTLAALNSSSATPKSKDVIVSVIENQVAPSIPVQTFIGVYHSITSKLNVSFTDFIISTLRFIGLAGICWAKRKTGNVTVQSKTVQCNSFENDALSIENATIKIELMRKTAQIITESLLEIASAGEERNKGKFFEKGGDGKDMYTPYPFTLFYDQGTTLVPFVLRVTVLLTGCSSKWMLNMRSKYGTQLAKIPSPTQEYISLIRTLLQKYSPTANIASPFSIVNETIGDGDFGTGYEKGDKNMNRLDKKDSERDFKNVTPIDIRCEPLLEPSLVQASWECGEIEISNIDTECKGLKEEVNSNIDFSSTKESLSIAIMLAKCRDEWKNNPLHNRNKVQNGIMASLYFSPERFVLKIPRIASFDDSILTDTVRLSCGLKKNGHGAIKGVDTLVGPIPPLFSKAQTCPGVEFEVMDALNKWWLLPGMSENTKKPFNQLFTAPLSLAALRSKPVDQLPLNDMGMSVAGVLNNYSIALDRILEYWPFSNIEKKAREAKEEKILANESNKNRDELRDISGSIDRIISAVPSYSVAPLIILTRQILGDIMERKNINGNGVTSLPSSSSPLNNPTMNYENFTNSEKTQETSKNLLGNNKNNSNDESIPTVKQAQIPKNDVKVNQESTQCNQTNEQKNSSATRGKSQDSFANASTVARNAVPPSISSIIDEGGIFFLSRNNQQQSQIIRKFLLLMLNTTPKGVCMRGTFILQQILIPSIISGAGWDIIGTAKVIYGNVMNALKVILQSDPTKAENNGIVYQDIVGNETNISLLPSLLGWQLINALVCVASQNPLLGNVVSAHIKSIILVGEIENWIENEKLKECLHELIQEM